MGFLFALLQLLQVGVELDERVISVILARDVGAKAAEFVQLSLKILGRGLDV